MQAKKLLIIGAGGHGRSVAEAALSNATWSEVHFTDDLYTDIKEVNGLPLVGSLKSYTHLGSLYDGVVVAIGNNEVRANIVRDCLKLNLPLTSIVHPRAFISQFAEIGVGTTIMAGVAVGANAKVGLACLINCNSCVDHDCNLEDFAHLGVGVHLAGGVTVGHSSVLFAGTCAGYHVDIPKGTTWGPGAALTHAYMMSAVKETERNEVLAPR